MAWPVESGAETDSPESLDGNVTSSTGHLNELPYGLQNYARGAVGFVPSNERRLSQVDMRDLRISNPYINRIRNGRRHSISDCNPSNAQQSSGINNNNIAQRHSVPCCHINPNVRHSCCFHLNRRLSLQNLNINRRNSFPQNYIRDYHNPESGTFGYTNARPTSLSFSHLFLFWNENFRADRYLQQAVSAAGPEFFMRFLASEIDRQGLQFPDDMYRDIDQSGDLPPSLIYLIERFSSSLERDMISYLVLRVQFPLDWRSFFAIVDGWNKGTPGLERIVTLFFFCADLAIRALCEGNVALFHEIVSWTVFYLRRSDSLVAVSPKKSSYIITLTTCVVGIVTLMFLMKRI
ncbi:uncharacterized protein LOC124795124 [Schistocerca piceifrons]|uniref:uncharacterized protein LOC124795124 n=1 Tax=Schistocerca piceifrons TaxID=274613 RepID=UPI001F5F9755|nr:uncharacterized protein LOC124795124 [Schistocerca piceifrons]